MCREPCAVSREPYTVCRMPWAKANEDVITSQHIMWEAEFVGLLFEHSNSTPSWYSWRGWCANECRATRYEM